MDVDLDELIKRAHTPNFKIMEYDVSVQPPYLTMGYLLDKSTVEIAYRFVCFLRLCQDRLNELIMRL